MSAYSYLYLVCLTVFCQLYTDLRVKAWPQAPQDAMDMAQMQMHVAKDTFASQIPGKSHQNNESGRMEGRQRRSAVLKRLKRQSEDENEFYDENSIIIPDREYPQRKDLGEHLREGIERLTESIKRTWNSFARSMEQLMDNIRQSFNGNQSSYNETREQSMELHLSDQ